MPEQKPATGDAMPDKPFRVQRSLEYAPASGLYLPELRVHVGRDGYSGGMTAYSWIRGEAVGAIRVPLVEQRWRDGPQSTEECVQVAIQGLRWYLGESGSSSS